MMLVVQKAAYIENISQMKLFCIQELQLNFPVLYESYTVYPFDRFVPCCFLGIQPLQLSFDMSLTEDKPEAPGETPDPQAGGLSGTRPLGLGVAVLPPLPPDTNVSMPILPSTIAQKKRS